MLKRHNGLVGLGYRLSDLIMIVGAWNLAYWVRLLHAPATAASGLPPFEHYAALSPAVAIVWLVTFTSRGIYTSRRMVRLMQEIRDVLSAHGVALLAFVAFAYFVERYKFSRLVIVYFALIGGLAITASHAAIRLGLRQLRRRGYNKRRMLIAGEGKAAHRVLNHLRWFPELGIEVVGVVTHVGSAARSVGDKPVIGTFGDTPRLLESERIDEVLIALSTEQSKELDHVLQYTEDETVDVRIIPDVQAYVTLNCEATDFEGMPVVRINGTPHEGVAGALKRSVDLVGAGAALLLLSPVLLAIALAVKLTSRGPILYSQERTGLDGKTFRMYKFRSMRPDVEEESGAVWASKNDDRRTPIGTFLRKTSLDELPQFWNVLLGHMSLVGPRPERPVFVSQFRDEIPHYNLRHKVKAGITGWAQVNGWRGNTSLERRIECDLFYIRNWSLGLDLRILLMTVWKGFVHKNAY